MEYKVRDRVEIIGNDDDCNTDYTGNKGEITEIDSELTRYPYYVAMDNGEEVWFSDTEIKLLTPKKFLVYNVTSQKSVGIMSEVSALKHAASTPNCEFQLYELRYNIVPKPVEVTYELQSV